MRFFVASIAEWRIGHEWLIDFRPAAIFNDVTLPLSPRMRRGNRSLSAASFTYCNEFSWLLQRCVAATVGPYFTADSSAKERTNSVYYYALMRRIWCGISINRKVLQPTRRTMVLGRCRNIALDVKIASYIRCRDAKCDFVNIWRHITIAARIYDDSAGV